MTSVKDVHDAISYVNAGLSVIGDIQSGNADKAVAKVVAPALAKVFGPGGEVAGDYIASVLNAPGYHKVFDKPPTLTYKLAPHYGTLTSDALKTMDEALKVAIDITIKQLGKAVDAGEDLSWDKVQSILANNVSISPYDDVKPPRAIAKLYEYNSDDIFRTDGSPDPTTVEKVKAWFRDTIGDQDVLDATAIDDAELTVLAKIVAETGVHVDASNVLYGKEHEERSVLDVGILRFPDLEHPYFQAFRIQLNAYRSSKRILFAEQNRNGLRLDFNTRFYKPNDEVIKGVKAETKAKAISELDDMFA